MIHRLEYTIIRPIPPLSLPNEIQENHPGIPEIERKKSKGYHQNGNQINV